MKPAPKRRALLSARALLVVIAAVVSLAACHGSSTKKQSSSDEPIVECVAYADLMKSCVGEQTGARLHASFAIPPRDEAARAKLRLRCLDQSAKTRRVCR